MSRFESRPLLALVSVFSCGLALAQEPLQHRYIQELAPIPEVEDFFDEYAAPSYQNPNEFGYDVAIRDGLAIVGMPLTFTTGRVAVFTQSASGWLRTGTLTASDKTSEDRFGHAVSYRDGLVVVGSKRAAYVFKRVNGVWRQQQRIVPSATDGVEFFARDLKHQGGVLAIGAQGDATTRDSVYVYEQDASGKFVRRARIRASDGHLGNRFGWSISMTSAIIVVGAPWQDTARGAAYILARNNSGQWVQRQKLVAIARHHSDSLGTAVAVDRGMILAGAPNALASGADPNLPVRGVVYGFLAGTDRYVESFQLYPPDSLPFQNFGSSIAMFDKRIAVGGSELPAYETEGPFFVATYSREGSSVLPLGSVSRLRGNVSLSIVNNLLLIGAPFTGSCLFAFECVGRAHLYHLNQFEP
jgi:FG-GAP repeat